MVWKHLFLRIMQLMKAGADTSLSLCQTNNYTFYEVIFPFYCFEDFPEIPPIGEILPQDDGRTPVDLRLYDESSSNDLNEEHGQWESP